MVTHSILTLFPEARVITRTNGLSDHAPVIIQLNHSVQHSHQPTLIRSLIDTDSFLRTMEQAWNIRVEGNPMFQVVQKLKAVKEARSHSP